MIEGLYVLDLHWIVWSHRGAPHPAYMNNQCSSTANKIIHLIHDFNDRSRCWIISLLVVFFRWLFFLLTQKLKEQSDFTNKMKSRLLTFRLKFQVFIFYFNVSLQMKLREPVQSCWRPCSPWEKTRTTLCCLTPCTRCVFVWLNIREKQGATYSSKSTGNTMCLYLAWQNSFVCLCVC